MRHFNRGRSSSLGFVVASPAADGKLASVTVATPRWRAFATWERRPLTESRRSASRTEGRRSHARGDFPSSAVTDGRHLCNGFADTGVRFVHADASIYGKYVFRAVNRRPVRREARQDSGGRRRAGSRPGHVKIDAMRGLHHAATRSVVDLPKSRKAEGRSRDGDRAELPAWSRHCAQNQEERIRPRLEGARTTP